MPFKRMTLTDLKVEIPRLASKKVITEAFNSAGAAWGCDEFGWGFSDHSSAFKCWCKRFWRCTYMQCGV
jgi:hypothetical protein